MRKIGRYKNGNYYVDIFDDGTKVRSNNLDSLVPDTVESFDLKITNMCNMGCPFCHENSTPNGKHGDILNAKFFETLHPYTEIAVGGGNPLEHPDLDKFLYMCREKRFIPSITVNQYHFEQNFDRIKNLYDSKLIFGIGVSLIHVTEELLNKLKQLPTAVVHVIAGLVSMDDLESLKNNNIKVLILGYKVFRRGESFYEYREEPIKVQIELLKCRLSEIIKSSWFKVISFDNLALKQLNVKSLLDKNVWDEFYMGDDGIDGEMTSASMFIDLVSNTFSRNSCSPIEERYPIMDTVEEMFNFIKNN